MRVTTKLTLDRGRVDIGPDLTVAIQLTLHSEPLDVDWRLLAKVLTELRGKPPRLIEMSLMNEGLMLVVERAEHVEGVLSWLTMPGGVDRLAAQYDELHRVMEQAHETATRALAAFKLV